jgi:hypothetical protein
LTSWGEDQEAAIARARDLTGQVARWEAPLGAPADLGVLVGTRAQIVVDLRAQLPIDRQVGDDRCQQDRDGNGAAGEQRDPPPEAHGSRRNT